MSDYCDNRDFESSENDCGNREVNDLKGKVDGFLVYFKNSSPKHVKAKKQNAQLEPKANKDAPIKICSGNSKRKSVVRSGAPDDRAKDVEYNQSENEVPKRVLKAKIPPTPKLLTAIEERTKLRAQRIADIKIKKNEKQLELQRECEAKMKRIFEAQELERIAKEVEETNMKERAEIEKKRVNKLKRLAIKHHNRHVMRRVFVRLRKIVQVARIKMLMMEEFHRKKIIRFVLKLWKANVDLKIAEDKKAASDFFQLKLFRNCLRHWKMVCEHYSRSRQTADDVFEFRITRSVFSHWLRLTRRQRKEYRQKMEGARTHHERKLVETYFRAWTSYPAINKLDHEKEKIKLILRLKVKDYLQDFEVPQKGDEI